MVKVDSKAEISPVVAVIVIFIAIALAVGIVYYFLNNSHTRHAAMGAHIGALADMKFEYARIIGHKLTDIFAHSSVSALGIMTG